jgi:hypothetical protein
VLPVSDSDNDITLWPGESQTIQISYDSSTLDGASPVDSVFGWNVPYFDVAARDTQNAPDEQQAAADRHGITSFGLADGVPRDHGAIVPGQYNTRAEMRELRRLFSVQTVNADRREAAR